MRRNHFISSRWIQFWVIKIGGIALLFYTGAIAIEVITGLMAKPSMSWHFSLPAQAQSLRPEGAAYIIYQRLTFIPKENQYIRQDTGEVDPEHTLISRFIRYNEDVKKRSSYRIDWQLTFADYLGANETIDPDRYPGKSTLKTNPAQADIAAINKLNLAQRQALVTLLAELYTPPEVPRTSVKPVGKPSDQQNSTPVRPGLAKPGDANLLLPP